MVKNIFFFLFTFFIAENLIGQVNGPPLPCTNGTQNTCRCGNSPTLCTINDLNGYEYSMSTFQHPNDGPQPMCPPPEGNNTTSNNPTWFAFLSWCTNLTIQVTYTNCTNPPGPSNGGIQAAVYSACPATASNAISCDTDGAGCNGNGVRTLNVSGMIPGNLYYFLVDGCAGSACDIRIDVIGPCSQTEPTPLTTVVGPRVLCKPNASSEYILVKNEFVNYHWFIDGNPAVNGAYLFNPTLNFNGLSEGNHQVCVDGSLPPCIGLNDNPAPYCFNVCVAPSTPNGGTITANSPVCPGVSVPVSVTGQNTGTGFVNHVFVTNSSGNIIEVIPNNGTTTTLNSMTCQELTVYSLNYYAPCAATPITPTVGMNLSAIQDSCVTCGCDLKSKIVSFQDNVPPVFVNPPAGGTFNCIFEAPGGTGSLAYTDNCIAPGSVDPVITGGTDPCDGGTITRTWTKEDDCGNIATHVQNITVGPSVIPAFQNVPQDITINCADQLPTNNSLTYTNGGTGLCLISGTVAATVTENYTACAGGTVVYNWEFTDGCNRTITATRTITINALTIPAFTNAPPDITVDCNSIPPTIPNLNYTNGLTGTCLISGTVAGAYVGDPPTVCGGTFTRTWTFTDQCGRTINHSQVITVTPVPEGSFVNPPDDITVNCNAIPANGANLVFSNGLTGPCQIQSTIIPTTGGSGDQCGGTKFFAWTFTDACGRTKVDTQFVIITPMAEPQFVNPPANITVSCENRPTNIPNLTVANNDPNCPINAVVPATQTGSATVCGGTITNTWIYTDVCNRTITHTQTVTVTPMPQAAYVNPPADITVNCNQVPTSAPNLNLTNNGLADCLINANVPAVTTGNGTQCGGTLTNTWTHTDVCNRVTEHVQNITINAILAPVFLNPPADITVTCDLIPANGTILTANNSDPNCPINQAVTPTQTGSATICGGTITYTWTFTDVCNRTITHTQNVTVTPMPLAVFINPPADITVTCDLIPSSAPQLTVRNNGPVGCNIDQLITPTQTGSATICGGTITYTWTFTDACNRTITHTQNVTVTPMPLAVFINPPADITVTCDLIPSSAPQLTVRNNGPVGCNIDQLITPTQTGSATICGGTITYTWTFTDACNRTITHTQNITVVPMPPGAFINPPADTVITCNNIPTTGRSLMVKNNGPASCNIDALVPPVQSGNATICGGIITYTWTYTDVCNRTITHTQNITVIPMPQAVFINPPADITVTCDLIPSSGQQLTVRNNGPTGCNIDQLVTPTQSGSATICGGTITYTWTFTDVCNRTITHTQNIVVTPMPIPQFVNPPSDTTVMCNAIPTVGQPLRVVNNANAPCKIDELIQPVQSGTGTICGGTITYTWTYTDQCGRTITHVRNFTIIPMLPGQFVNTPQSQTVACADIPSSAPSLQIRNNGPAACLIDAIVPAVLEGNPSPCGGSFNYKWEYTDVCNRTTTHLQTITVTPTSQGDFVNPPSNELVTCSQIPPISSFTDLTFSNNLTGTCGINATVTPVVTGSANECGGTIVATWAYTDFCNRTKTHTKTVTVSPAPQAVFGNIPPNITVSCDNVDNSPISITYSNNVTGSCAIQGSVLNIRTGIVNACGGTYIDTWTFTDLCGRTISASRTINVLPAPAATFINLPPATLTLNCGDVISTPDISYSNGLIGDCGIEGDISPVQNGIIDACGGTTLLTWSFTDACNRSISFTQTITVLPSPLPEFVDPPADENLDCGGINNPPQFIPVSNGLTGPCSLNDNAPLVSVTQNGTTYTNVWSFIDPCTNQVITHTQITSTILAPSLFVSNPDPEICQGETFDLSTLDVIDLNNTNPVITYHSLLPASPNNQLPAEVMPNPGDFYYIVGVNSQGCEDAVIIYFNVIVPPSAGGDGTAKICNDGSVLNLTTLLNGGAATNGSWKQIGGNNINLSTPTAVSFLNISAGVYNLSYIVQSNSNCPSDTAFFAITVTNLVNLDLATVSCIVGGTYEIKVITKAPTVTTTLGTVQKLTNDTIRIFNIPQGQGITINASTTNNVCQTSLSINSPDCSCPFIPEPLGTPFYSVCEGTVNIEMSVTVPVGMEANWYLQKSGGTALVKNSLTYSHTNGSPGTYKYYVETYNPANDCYSLTRFEIVVEIYSSPTVQPFTYSLCDEANNGTEIFDLTTVIDDVASLTNSVTFHLTQVDAQNGTNPLPLMYTNTSNPQTIYALVVGTTGCKNITTITLNLFESPKPIVTPKPESCNGSGDGSITVSQTTPGTYQYNLNNQGWTSNTIFAPLPVGNYVLVSENQNGCRTQNNTVVGQGLIVVIETFKIECDNKGTLTDATDDVIKFIVKVENNLNEAGNYILTNNAGFNNTYPYNSEITFTLPANGTTLTFEAKDALRNCVANRTVGPLTSCSTTCLADLKIISYECNGNNTPSDPSDDFYVLKFSVAATNGAANNKFSLFVDNILKGLFDYGVDHTINVPATNQLANVRVLDNDDIQCGDNVDIGPLNNCSDQCVLTAVIESIDCNNPGSTPTPSDDFYEIKVKATLTNGGNSTGYKIITETGQTFNGVYGTTLTITLPADNLAHKLTFVDNIKTDCKNVIDINPLAPCSGPCEVEVKLAKATCNNNGTTNDSSDDFYEVTIAAKLINGGSSDDFKATVNGKDYNGIYGKDLVIVLPADGKSYKIDIVDAISPECKGSVTTDLLLSCSIPCNINANVISFDCNDGGTTSDTGDDTYTVTILATIVNGGGSISYTATVDGKDYPGIYDQNLVIPFKADNVVHIIQIKDKTNGVCTATVNTPILAPCSGPCVINAVVSNIKCDNGGTNTTDADDQFYFDILVTGNNTKWKIDQLDTFGAVGTTMKLGPYKIKDAISSFLVYFENSPNCKQQITITVPATCSSCKQTVDAGNGGKLTCTQNAILLSATSSETGSYAWYLKGKLITNDLSFGAGQAGWYIFIAKYNDGCEAKDSVEVTSDGDLPIVTITRELKLTCQIKEVTIVATATGNNLQYEWTDELGVVIGTGLTLKVTKEGKYFFRAFNPISGCSSSKVLSEVIKDEVQPSSIIYAKPTTIFDCVIKLITLYNDEEKDVLYKWVLNDNNISTNKSLEITSVGDYKLIAIDTVSGCENESLLKITSLIEYPIINLSVNDTLDCTTEKVFVSSAGSQVGPNITYEWRDKNKKAISSDISGIDVTSGGTYYLFLKDTQNGCTNEDTIQVEAFESDIELNIPTSIFVAPGDTVRLNTLINIPKENIKSIKWTPAQYLSCTDCLNPLATPEEDITYRVEIEDIFGCKGEAEVRLIIRKPQIINIPNVISTGSGTNSGFTLYGNDQVKIIKELKVFDRWGNLLFVNKNFEPNNPSLGWDGKFNGKDVVPGVYVFIFDVDINAIGSRVYTGDVTVIK